jgi:cystathionine beta-synthase
MRENGFLERPRRTTMAEVVAAKEKRVGDLLTVEPSTSIRMALSTMTAHDIGQLPVVLEGNCVGSLTEARLMSLVIEDPERLDKPVETVMGAPFPVLEGHIDSDEMMHVMKRNAACLVRIEGELAGIVTRYDVVRVLTA